MRIIVFLEQGSIKENDKKEIDNEKFYLKYTRKYFKETTGMDFSENFMIRKILTASMIKITPDIDNDFALGFLLFNLENNMMSDAIDAYYMKYSDQEIEVVERAIEKNAQRIEGIFSFLLRNFPEKGRSQEEYRKQIFRLVAEYEKNNLQN